MSESDFRNIEVDPEVKAVIVGFADSFSYYNTCILSLYLQNPNVLFLATNNDPLYVFNDKGRRIPDVGPLISAVKASLDPGRQFAIAGKPNTFAFDLIKRSLLT